jgi:predicted DCC family thiol-disulfide oxidoreductase YuxK
MENLPFGKKIILFDGVCNLCNTSVQYIIKHDKKDIFRFVSLQSELGQAILKYIGVDTTKTDSFILYEPGIAYYAKAEAAYRVSKELNGIISVLGIFSVFPKFFQNLCYDFIAKNRYKWYGKKENCLVPTPELNSKFL